MPRWRRTLDAHPNQLHGVRLYVEDTPQNRAAAQQEVDFGWCRESTNRSIDSAGTRSLIESRAVVHRAPTDCTPTGRLLTRRAQMDHVQTARSDDIDSNNTTTSARSQRQLASLLVNRMQQRRDVPTFITITGSTTTAAENDAFDDNTSNDNRRQLCDSAINDEPAERTVVNFQVGSISEEVGEETTDSDGSSTEDEVEGTECLRIQNMGTLLHHSAHDPKKV